MGKNKIINGMLMPNDLFKPSRPVAPAPKAGSICDLGNTLAMKMEKELMLKVETLVLLEQVGKFTYNCCVVVKQNNSCGYKVEKKYNKYIGEIYDIIHNFSPNMNLNLLERGVKNYLTAPGVRFITAGYDGEHTSLQMWRNLEDFNLGGVK